MSSKLPSADDCAAEIAAILAAHLNASIGRGEEGTVDIPTIPIIVHRNAWLEAAAEAVRESGYLYGRESALAAIRKLKEEP